MPISLPVPVSPQDWQQGPPDAPNTLVEYGDFECGDCIVAFAELKSLLAEQSNRLRFVYRHLPLTDVHPHALDAAKAAEAAGAEGKFWEMHDALYQNRRRLERDDLEELAEQIGLNTEQFANAMEDPRTTDEVRADVDGLRVTGLGSTPSIFLNGVHYTGPVTRDALAQALTK